MVDLDARPAPTPFSERVGLLCVRYMEAINLSLFKLSDGLVGGSIFGAPVILLTLSGRVTGTRRTKPLLALVDGESWIVVGSRGGTAGHPQWYLNLLEYEVRAAAGTLDRVPRLDPPTVEAPGTAPVAVRATVLEDAARERWWDDLAALYGRFESYQARAPQREIPVIRLTPTH